VGLTHVTARVASPARKSAVVRFLVDSGAVYSLLPLPTWKSIGLKAKRRLTFTLADGTTVERRVSECRFTLEGQDGHSPVILGEKGDQALLGVVTLATLGLVLNPFSRTLHPMRLVLARLPGRALPEYLAVRPPRRSGRRPFAYGCPRYSATAALNRASASIQSGSSLHRRSMSTEA
jgi:predicted aspartyl protease